MIVQSCKCCQIYGQGLKSPWGLTRGQLASEQAAPKIDSLICCVPSMQPHAIESQREELPNEGSECMRGRQQELHE